MDVGKGTGRGDVLVVLAPGGHGNVRCQSHPGSGRVAYFSYPCLSTGYQHRLPQTKSERGNAPFIFTSPRGIQRLVSALVQRDQEPARAGISARGVGREGERTRNTGRASLGVRGRRPSLIGRRFGRRPWLMGGRGWEEGGREGSEMRAVGSARLEKARVRHGRSCCSCWMAAQLDITHRLPRSDERERIQSLRARCHTRPLCFRVDQRRMGTG